GLVLRKSLSISGNVTADATAVTGVKALGNANAGALISLLASSGKVPAGQIDAEALASDHGAGKARGNAQIQVLSSSNAGGAITIGALKGNANANDLGVGSALAIADATLAAGAVTITGNATLV